MPRWQRWRRCGPGCHALPEWRRWWRGSLQALRPEWRWPDRSRGQSQPGLTEIRGSRRHGSGPPGSGRGWQSRRARRRAPPYRFSVPVPAGFLRWDAPAPGHRPPSADRWGEPGWWAAPAHWTGCGSWGPGAPAWRGAPRRGTGGRTGSRCRARPGSGAPAPGSYRAWCPSCPADRSNPTCSRPSGCRAWPLSGRRRQRPAPRWWRRWWCWGHRHRCRRCRRTRNPDAGSRALLPAGPRRRRRSPPGSPPWSWGRSRDWRARWDPLRHVPPGRRRHGYFHGSETDPGRGCWDDDAWSLPYRTLLSGRVIWASAWVSRRAPSEVMMDSGWNWKPSTRSSCCSMAMGMPW